MQVKNKKVFFRNLGLIDYKQAWDYQTSLFDSIVKTKIANRDMPENEQLTTSNFLLFCEHPHVYTLGKSGKASNLLISGEMLKEKKATYYEINRGGDITYHGPGQIVAYPVFDLDNFFTDIHKYLRYLEEAVIRTIEHYGIKGGRIDGLTGVWVESENPATARKICAMGVKASRWITMHGLGFNVNTDLSYFGNIIPCGIEDKAVTSLARETGRELNIKEVQDILLKHLTELFELEIYPAE
jgi:lipoyl(octanoyl) transferase